MTASTRVLSTLAATAVAAVAVWALLAAGGSDPVRAAIPTQVRLDCASQSSARFPGAYRDRRNLVVGPLAMAGGATFTDARTARRFGGNKYPLLVRAGHTVTVSVPASRRRAARIAYGPFPDGELRLRDAYHTITFVSCPPERAASTAGGPVTFWSGFVMVSEPQCVPLDVYVDGDPKPKRVRIELGRRCATAPRTPG